MSSRDVVGEILREALAEAREVVMRLERAAELEKDQGDRLFYLTNVQGQESRINFSDVVPAPGGETMVRGILLFDRITVKAEDLACAITHVVRAGGHALDGSQP